MAKVELRNVTKAWDKATAVKDMSLVIEDGEFVSLLGPSGCGKERLLTLATTQIAYDVAIFDMTHIATGAGMRGALFDEHLRHYSREDNLDGHEKMLVPYGAEAFDEDSIAKFGNRTVVLVAKGRTDVMRPAFAETTIWAQRV